MQDVEYLDGPGLYRWVRRAVGELTARRAEINALNVFPVPDADTGSNMAHTMEAALKEVEALAADELFDVAKVSAAMATGSVRGARGNSGVVLSQVLRGLAQSAAQGNLDGKSIQQALNMGNSFVVRAINEPVEGTVITVLRAAAIAANQASSTSLVDVLGAATKAAQVALDNTPSQLAVLREAGVVDAGAKGLVVLLDSLFHEVCNKPSSHVAPLAVADDAPRQVVKDVRPTGVTFFGRLMQAHFIGEDYPQPLPPSPFGQPQLLAQMYAEPLEIAPAPPAPPATPSQAMQVSSSPQGDQRGEQQLEVMFFIEDADLDNVRDSLAPLGNSFIVAAAGQDSGTIHIHTTEPEAVVEAAYCHGKVSNLHFELLPPPQAANPVQQLVVLCPAGELAEYYQQAGAVVIVPSTSEDVVVAITAQARSQAVTELIVVPNGHLSPYELSSLEQSSRAFEQNIAFVATSGLLPSLAAVRNHDGSQPVAVAAYLMAQAAARNTFAAITLHDDEYLGWVDGVLVLSSTDLHSTVDQVIAKVLRSAHAGSIATVIIDTHYAPQLEIATEPAAGGKGDDNRNYVREKVCIIEISQLYETIQGTVAEIGVI